MAAGKKVIFYVVAHADDWQLFMNPETFKDICSNDKVVIIVTTAGDAGMNETFWKAREEGMKSSVLFCLNPFNSSITIKHRKRIDLFNLNYFSLNNVVVYFLRLPDGGLDGNGFSSNENQSLSKLKSGKLDQITSLDKSLCFKTWEQFWQFLEKIILGECDNVNSIFLKYLNPDEKENSTDHPDHKATGEAIKSFETLKSCQRLFMGYGNCSEKKLSSENIFWKAGIFAAYEKTVYDLSGYRTLAENPELYERWCINAPEIKTIG